MKLTPSQAPRWVPCPGSAHMESLFPRTATHPVTEEGKAIHWACEGVLRSWLPQSPTEPHPLTDYIGHTCPENGVIVTEEMVTAGNVYLAAVWSRAQAHIEGLAVELKVSAQHAGLLSDGRVDTRWRSPDGKWLTIWDGKFGYSEVGAFQNWQLAVYGIAEAYPGVETIELVIVQPRGMSIRQPVKTWILKRVELDAYRDMIVERHGLAQLGERAPTIAGKHCRNCDARASCGTNRAQSWQARDTAGQSIPQTLTPEEIAYELDEFDQALEMIRGRKLALEALATSNIERGQPVPGWHLHVSLTDREWRSKEQAAAMGPLFGIEMTESKTISPAQAETRGIQTAAVNALTIRHERPPKLRREKI